MKVSKELYEELKKLVHAKLDESGRELLNPNQVEIPVHMDRPPTLQERIQRLMRVELSKQAQAQEMETFEDANDFDIDDEDPDPVSPYEVHEMIEEEIKEKKTPLTPDQDAQTDPPAAEPADPDPEAGSAG